MAILKVSLSLLLVTTLALGADPYAPDPYDYKPAYSPKSYSPKSYSPKSYSSKGDYDGGYKDEYYNDHPQYQFYWVVKDDYGNDYWHREERDGYNTKGEYYVYLPDGRRQTVTYYVDEYGYHADVKYDGEPQYDYPKGDYKGYGSSYKPSYKPAYQEPSYGSAYNPAPVYGSDYTPKSHYSKY